MTRNRSLVEWNKWISFSMGDASCMLYIHITVQLIAFGMVAAQQGEMSGDGLTITIGETETGAKKVN